MKFGVIVFPGSNCDHDAYHVISKHVGQPVDFIWHRDTDLSSYDAVIIPGGFSYGDYLRAGALARFSPVMNSVKKFSESGRLVLGICNGFQILCEAGLLPGALIRNRDLHFICEHVQVRVENSDTPFTNELERGSVLSLPIAHAEGNYVCDDATLETLKREELYVNRYRDLAHLRRNMAVFIEQYYNRTRLHSALGYRPPEEFEQTVAPVTPCGAATMQFFEPPEGSASEGVKRVKKNVRPTGVC